MATLAEFKKDFKKLSRPADATILQRFFKTGPGEYGEGDIFAGIKVPPCRTLAKKYQDFSLKEIQTLIKSKIHEERAIALMILVLQFNKAWKKKDEKTQGQLFKFYMKNLKGVNNWDLVDASAPYLSGPYLFERDRKILYKLALSKDLWEKRVAMLSCYYFIRQKDFKDALKIAEILLFDEHDLMHKAVGWMLREIGNRDLAVEKKFLDTYSMKMPRTALRYAIEKFPEKERLKYLKMKTKTA
ncbi:DNA alkylation repair protein [Bdellovibrio sp. HCB337]|uniref:DNA alkylation repair protein n=1 Tax=Bdellovibrio sp. HCB337 TaxID=3394358 RepID=UPI0039A43D92